MATRIISGRLDADPDFRCPNGGFQAHVSVGGLRVVLEGKDALTALERLCAGDQVEIRGDKLASFAAPARPELESDPRRQIENICHSA